MWPLGSLSRRDGIWNESNLLQTVGLEGAMGHDGPGGATWIQERPRGAAMGPRAATRENVEPILKESAPLLCQPALILEDFVQLSDQPTVIA